MRLTAKDRATWEADLGQQAVDTESSITRTSGPDSVCECPLDMSPENKSFKSWSFEPITVLTNARDVNLIEFPVLRLRIADVFPFSHGSHGIKRGTIHSSESFTESVQRSISLEHILCFWMIFRSSYIFKIMDPLIVSCGRMKSQSRHLYHSSDFILLLYDRTFISELVRSWSWSCSPGGPDPGPGPSSREKIPQFDCWRPDTRR